jgi:hypothetical protein
LPEGEPSTRYCLPRTTQVLESFIAHLTYSLSQTTSTSSLDHWRSTLKENSSDVKMRQNPVCSEVVRFPGTW